MHSATDRTDVRSGVAILLADRLGSRQCGHRREMAKGAESNQRNGVVGEVLRPEVRVESITSFSSPPNRRFPMNNEQVLKFVDPSDANRVPLLVRLWQIHGEGLTS